MFERIRRKKLDKIINSVEHKDIVKRYGYLILGCLLVALAFNIFLKPFHLVCFGVSGLSIIFNKYNIDNSLFILISNILLLILSYFALGKKKTKNAIVGSLIFPIFVFLTSFIVPFLKFENLEMLVVALFGGVLSGIGYGLIYKTNFNTGGTDIICEIVSKYTKVSLGRAMWVSDGIVVMLGLLINNFESILYCFLILYLISFMTDRVVLGISQSKAFYIVTKREKEVRDFLLSINSGVTLIKARGGHSNDKEMLLLGVVPTRQYFLVKEALKEIDSEIFFLSCDAYEVSKKADK